MKKIDFILKSFISAACVFAYISIVAWFGFNSQRIFGRIHNGKADNFLMPLLVLLLFVISASITGLLVLGKPIQLYFNGLKKEAITLLFSTLSWLIVFLIVVLAVLLLR